MDRTRDNNANNKMQRLKYDSAYSPVSIKTLFPYNLSKIIASYGPCLPQEKKNRFSPSFMNIRLCMTHVHK